MIIEQSERILDVINASFNINYKRMYSGLIYFRKSVK